MPCECEHTVGQWCLCTLGCTFIAMCPATSVRAWPALITADEWQCVCTCSSPRPLSHFGYKGVSFLPFSSKQRGAGSWRAGEAQTEKGCSAVMLKASFLRKKKIKSLSIKHPRSENSPSFRRMLKPETDSPPISFCRDLELCRSLQLPIVQYKYLCSSTLKLLH